MSVPLFNQVARTKAGVLTVCFAAMSLLTGCNVQPNASGTNGKVPTARAEIQAASGTGDPNAIFKGCWHKQAGRRYQAVDITVRTAGTYNFNALLYHGPSCNPNDKADQFGYGEPLQLGTSTYTFWFTAFANHPNMSALWQLGDQTSQCVDYADAPDC